MSTDPTKQPAPPSEEPAETAAPPTVQAPAQPAGRWGQEPPTMPVPQWAAAPPPPPGPSAPPPPEPSAPPLPEPEADRSGPPPDPAVPPTQWDRPAQPTQWDRPAQPTQWDAPPPHQPTQPPPTQQQPTQQQPPQPTFQQRPAGQQRPAAAPQWQQPQSQWQREPQDAPPPQWSPPPPVQPLARGGGFRRRGRKRKVRRSVMALFVVIVIAILLVIGDRVALAVTENQFASQFQKQGFPVKPSVSIDGFPFLTQLAAKDFNQVDISASNVPAGPVTITSIHATINGMHISSYSSSASAKVDKMNANAFISFGALTAAGGLGGSGITVTPDGPDKLKISAGLGGVFTDTEEAQVTQSGPQKISVTVLPSGGPLGALLGSFASFSFELPKGVPASLKITGLTLNSQGLNVSASATNATFSQ